MTMNKSYEELITLPTFKERFEYLRTDSTIGAETFGVNRWLNQNFYNSPHWVKNIRRDIIMRDYGFDLGVEGYNIVGPIYIHHINPITLDDIRNRTKKLTDPNNLISCSFETHNAIHYGTFESVHSDLVERTPNDTCPWLL